jgi:polyisoprenoid-binding protein YceI
MTGMLLAALVAAALPAGKAMSVDPAASTVRYHVTHKLHQVEGTSSQIEGKVVLQTGGKVLTMVRVPVASFRSGDGNRDEHMEEALDLAKYPFAVFKGLAQLNPSGELRSGPLNIQGELDLHGVKRPMMVPLSVEVQADGAIRVRGSFDVSLDAYGIERPSLLFVKIDDNCRMDVDLTLREDKR